MNTSSDKCNVSIIFKEVDRLSIEPDLMMTEADLTEYDEIRVLGEILRDTQSPSTFYYTGD
jgi:hypothetical protein